VIALRVPDEGIMHFSAVWRWHIGTLWRRMIGCNVPMPVAGTVRLGLSLEFAAEHWTLKAVCHSPAVTLHDLQAWWQSVRLFQVVLASTVCSLYKL